MPDKRGSGCRTLFFALGTQVEVPGGGIDIALGKVRHRDMRQRTEQFEQSAVVIGQKSVLPAVERLEIFGVEIEIGRSLVRSDQRAPMLVLPAFRIVDPHVAYGLAGTVGMTHVDGQLHHPVRSEDTGAVALRALHEMFAQIDDAPAAQQVREVLDRGQVCERQDRHGSTHSPSALISSTRRSSASCCGMLRATTVRPL